jgi:hypothetical protein
VYSIAQRRMCAQRKGHRGDAAAVLLYAIGGWWALVELQKDGSLGGPSRPKIVLQRGAARPIERILDVALALMAPAWWGRSSSRALRRCSGETLQDARKPMHTDPQSLVDVWSRRNEVLGIPPKWLIFLRSLGDSNPCFRRERAMPSGPTVLCRVLLPRIMASNMQ